ncbi:hypothetical protein CAEBREN_08629 [Caenorhabditis brenneri]|uniref:Uncharacterized protein n=1 Tax=Caenorhabditis brenneri TaxID=135651 RepID=G0NIJ4_CAEBE|nr:hypothetical protein CAEBREN_08629 [Caenorhabditis brenneri]
MTESPETDQTEELLNQISYLSLEFDDVQKLTNFLLIHAKKLKETDYVIDVYRRYCYGVIRCVEVDKKCAKRFIPNFISTIQVLKEHDRVLKNVMDVLLSLPIMLQSRWDLITMLASSKMVTELDELLFVEVMSCAPDQDLSARCSSTVLHMASNPKTSDRAAQIIYNGLVSPVFSVRNNVHRSWLCRIINMKSSLKCIEKLLDLCRDEVMQNTSKMWPVAFREIAGLTCCDLEWRAVLEEEPYDTLTFALLAYFAVLIALKHTSSQVHIKLKPNDDVVVKGIEYFGAVAAKQAFIVCSKYKVYPPGLEKAIICEMQSNRNPDIYDVIDDDMIKTFTPDTQMMFTKEKLQYFLAQKKLQDLEKKKQGKTLEPAPPKAEKFYPAEDDGSFKIIVNLNAEKTAKESIDRAIRAQHPTEEYPSVAAVMEHLHTQNIDERLYCQKIMIINDLCRAKFVEQKYSRGTYTELVFKMITKIPLRSVVDYVGATIKLEAFKDVMFREKIFQMACDLMKLDDENARPLSLYHCFISTCYQEPEKVTEVWNIVKSLKSGVKKRKMAEMLSKVVTSSEIEVNIDDLHDMILCSLGIHRQRFDGESTQLFVAATSKLLDFRNESERIMLFQAIADKPELLEVIDNILLHNTTYFSDAAFQMVLYFFTRFHIGAIEFYPTAHIKLIAKIVNFCHWCIRKFAGEQMILGVAIDAICGYLPWSYLREKALLKEEDVTKNMEDPVEKLIVQNLRHNRLCNLLAEHDKEDKMLSIEDFELLPKAEFIVEILRKKDQGIAELNKLAKKLAEMVKTAKAFEDVHAVWLAYGLLSDKALEMIDDAESYRDTDANYKSRYPSRTLMDSLVDVGAGFNTSIADLRMANSWLDKGLGKIQILTDREFCLDDCPP